MSNYWIQVSEGLKEGLDGIHYSYMILCTYKRKNATNLANPTSTGTHVARGITAKNLWATLTH